jgi:hypothetical protein
VILREMGTKSLVPPRNEPPVRALAGVRRGLHGANIKGRWAGNDRSSLVPARPVVIGGPALSCSTYAAYSCENCYGNRDPKLAPSEIKSAPDNLNRLSVPVQTTVRINAQAVDFGERNRSYIFGPLGFVDGLKRDSPQFFFTLSVFPSGALRICFHGYFAFTLSAASRANRSAFRRLWFS